MSQDQLNNVLQHNEVMNSNPHFELRLSFTASNREVWDHDKKINSKLVNIVFITGQ